MLNKTLILLIIASFCLTAKNKFFRNDSEIEYLESLKCYPKVINLIEINGYVDSKAEIADEDVKSICPSLKYTCCDYSQVHGLAENYLEGLKNLNKFREYNKQIVEGYKALSKVDFQGIQDEAIGDGSCMTEEVFEKALGYFDTINVDAMTQKLEDFIEHTSKYYSGFGCSLCDAEKYTGYSNKREYGENIFYMGFSPQNVRDMLNFGADFIDFTENFYKIATIAKAGYCYFDLDIEEFNDMRDPSYAHDLAEFFRNCAALDDKNIVSDRHRKCVRSLKSIGYRNELELMGNMVDLFEDSIRGLSYIKNMNIGEIEFEEYDGKVVFFPKNESSHMNLDQTKLNLQSTNPLDFSANAFAESIWKQGKLAPMKKGGLSGGNQIMAALKEKFKLY